MVVVVVGIAYWDTCKACAVIYWVQKMIVLHGDDLVQ